MARINPDDLELSDKVVKIKRVAKVLKGGRRFSFTALVIVGDGKGYVGDGYGKAREIPDAIRKGIESAKKHLVRIPVNELGTIPHPVIGKYGAARVLLKPAGPGTGVIAGSAVRIVLELAGVHNILSKVLSSSNSVNVARATLKALNQLKKPEDVAKMRGKELAEILEQMST